MLFLHIGEALIDEDLLGSIVAQFHKYYTERTFELSLNPCVDPVVSFNHRFFALVYQHDNGAFKVMWLAASVIELKVMERIGGENSLTYSASRRVE